MTTRKVQAEQLDMASTNSEQFTTGGANDLTLSDKVVISDVSDSNIAKVATIQQVVDLVNITALGGVSFQGMWDASINSPQLDGVGGVDPTTVKGHYYVTNVAGTQFSENFAVGDWVISDGTAWQKVDNSDAVVSVNGYTGVVVLVKGDVGLSNVDNTSDVNKPISTATQLALNAKEDSSNKGQPNGYASLDAGGKIPQTQIPNIAISNTFIVASQAAMLALSTAETGDIAVRTDLNRSFILDGTYSTLADWKELLTPTDSVLSVNGYTGTVSLTYTDVGAAPSSHVGTGGASHADATTSVAGFMSAADKTKLNAITGTNTGDQTISLTGDVTAPGGTGALVTTLSNTGVSAGTYEIVTVDAKGRVTAGSNPSVAYAPSDATYLTLSSNATLTGERTLALTANQLSGSDGGTGNPYTVSIANNPILPGTDSVTIPSGTTDPAVGAAKFRFNTTNAGRAKYSTEVAWLEIPGVVSRNTTLTTFTGLSTAAGGTDIMSVTVPGGLLGVDGILKITIIGVIENDAAGGGSNRTFTVHLKYGGNTFYSDASAVLAGLTEAGFKAEIYLVADNATNSQNFCGQIAIGSTTGATTGRTGNMGSDEIISNDLITSVDNAFVVDSTVNQTLAIALQASGATTNFQRYFYTIERM